MRGSGSIQVLAEGRLPGPAFERLPGVELVDGSLAECLSRPRPGVRAAIVLGGAVGPELLAMLPDLEVVVRFGVGYDLVDVAACTERGVQVSITPGPVEEATAELAVALILALRRRILAADATVRAGGWSSPVTELPGERGIHSATIGLVGFGRIGRRVALATSALGAQIVYTSRSPAPPDVEAATGGRWASLEELCATSDVVSVHCPLDESTRGLIGAAELARVRDGGALINTARGPIVDEAALIEAVRDGRIEAGLDVFAAEPAVPVELRESPHVVLSPHVGSNTLEARTRMTELAVDNVLAVLAGGHAPHLIPEQRGSAPFGED